METITIVGAGVAGMTAAITLAEAGAPVVLFDAREAPGGRARSLDGPYRANLGPHVLYKDGPMFGWLDDRALLPPLAGVPLTGLRLRWGGELHRTPPLSLIPATLKLRGRRAPVDESFRAWATRHTDAHTAGLLSAPPACSRSTTIRASCRPRSCGSARSARCSRRRPRRATCAVAGAR